MNTFDLAIAYDWEFDVEFVSAIEKQLQKAGLTTYVIDDKNIFDALTVSTFHAFCVYFIKMESKKIGLSTDFLIFDEEEQVELAKKILK